MDYYDDELDSAVDALKEAVMVEMWSDAARAAAAAGRRHRGKGAEKRKEAGRKAFARSSSGRNAAVKSHRKAAGFRAWGLQVQSTDRANAKARRFNAPTRSSRSKGVDTVRKRIVKTVNARHTWGY